MARSDKTVVVFYMNGCPACHEYLPRFRRLAAKYRPFVAIKAANISLAPGAKSADEYKVKYAPTTLVLDATGKSIHKLEGSGSDREIEKLFKVATEGVG